MRTFLVVVFALAACQSGSVDPTSSPNNNSPPPSSGNPPPTGSGGAPSTSIDLLHFTMTGDTRPGNCNDTGSYPADVFRQVVAAMAATHPQFAIDLGDHMYACQQDTQSAQAQMALYQQAVQSFPAPFYMTMGNHECETTDCSATPNDANFAAYSAVLQTVSKQTLPYYALNFSTRTGRATLVFVADNYFDSTAQRWLDDTLTDADRHSTYTIVVKHHPMTGRTGPQGPLNVITQHKFTLILTAHNHNYSHDTSGLGGRSVVCGLGGANARHTGFCAVQQQADGSMQFTQFDDSGNPGDSWSVGPQ